MRKMTVLAFRGDGARGREKDDGGYKSMGGSRMWRMADSNVCI
jgi:hypothetical protein